MGNALILALSLHHYEKLRVIQYITKKVEMPLVKNNERTLFKKKYKNLTR